MPANGCTTRCANGCDAAARVTGSRGLGERMLSDIEVTRADAIYLTNKPFWKE